MGNENKQTLCQPQELTGCCVDILTPNSLNLSTQKCIPARKISQKPENNHTPHPNEGHKTLHGGGVLTGHNCKGMYEANVELPEGWRKGVKTKNTFYGREMVDYE